MTRAVPELSLVDFTQGDAARRDAFSTAFFEGLKDYGFVILTDHGIAPEFLSRAYGLAEQVFALPEDVKRHHAAGMRGYTPFGTEHAKDSGHPDLKEFWQIGHAPPPGVEVDAPFPDNVWPHQVPEFEPVFTVLFDRLNETGLVMLRALAPRLGLVEGWFDDKVRWGTSILRVLHYPPVADGTAAGAARSAAHEDINFLTLMVAAKGKGLELLDRDGSWLPVETAPTNLIVDSGDMLARLTNGVIPATTHRVVNPAGDNVSRYSMPFFMHPTLETRLDVLPSCVGDGARFPAGTAGDYLHERLKAIGMA